MTSRNEEPAILIVDRKYLNGILKSFKKVDEKEFRSEDPAAVIADAQVFLKRFGYSVFVIDFYGSETTYDKDSGKKLGTVHLARGTFYIKPK